MEVIVAWILMGLKTYIKENQKGNMMKSLKNQNDEAQMKKKEGGVKIYQAKKVT